MLIPFEDEVRLVYYTQGKVHAIAAYIKLSGDEMRLKDAAKFVNDRVETWEMLRPTTIKNRKRK